MHMCPVRYVSRPELPMLSPRAPDMSATDPQGNVNHSLKTTIIYNFNHHNKNQLIYMYILNSYILLICLVNAYYVFIWVAKG